MRKDIKELIEDGLGAIDCKFLQAIDGGARYRNTV